MPAKQRHGPLGCPSAHCSGGTTHRQQQINDAQLDQISGDARSAILENRAFRCIYCGAVYIRDERPRILGYLDNEIMGEGWHPIGSS